MAALIELFAQLLLVDSAANDRDAPAWIRRCRIPLRVALTLSSVVAIPLLGLMAWGFIAG